MDDDPSVQDLQKIQQLIRNLEHLSDRIEAAETTCRSLFEELWQENNEILAEMKLLVHSSVMEAERHGYDLMPEIPVEDKKLKAVWIALFRHHNGATADEIAADLHRHRTTISTHLNTLVLMQLAKKERIRHEIYYKAILMQKGERDP
ncbi:MAG: hypothetical protein PHT99_03340 [Methanoregula sp.]|nr:hypothetical protein [Methanoregula sp.]